MEVWYSVCAVITIIFISIIALEQCREVSEQCLVA